MTTNHKAASDDISGRHLVVLPKNYLKSAVAVSEIYENELSDAAGNLEIQGWGEPRVLRVLALAAVLWALSSIWSVCW